MLQKPELSAGLIGLPARKQALPYLFYINSYATKTVVKRSARVRNMSSFNGGKLRGNSKHFFKKSKDKAVPGKRSFKLLVSGKVPVYLPLTLSPPVLCFDTVFLAKLSYELLFVNALN